MSLVPFTDALISVTGASTGLGRALTELVLEKDEIVVATLRNPPMLDDLVQKYPPTRILVLKLDVTQEEQIVDAFLRAKTAFGRIDVVVNNAGVGQLGEVETTDEGKTRALMETNFWGALRVTKEAVRFLRDENPACAGGRLLQMSSYLGLVGLPATGSYAAAKFGKYSYRMEDIMSYRRCTSSRGDHRGACRRDRSKVEHQSTCGSWSSTVLTLTSVSLQVTILEPGWIRSNMGPRLTWPSEHSAYAANPSLPSTAQRHGKLDDFVVWKDTRRSVEVFYKVASLPSPPLHLLVGKDAIEATRKKIAILSEEINEYEAWSEGLEE